MLKKDLILFLADLLEHAESTGGDISIKINEIKAVLGKERSPSSVPSDIREFVRRYYLWLADHGGKKKNTAKELKSAEATVYALVRIDNYDFMQEIGPALRWAVQDSFWSAQVRSLARLRSKSRNGASKFDNLFAAYTAANTALKKVPMTIREERDESAKDRIAALMRKRAASGRGIGRDNNMGRAVAEITE